MSNFTKNKSRRKNKSEYLLVCNKPIRCRIQDSEWRPLRREKKRFAIQMQSFGPWSTNTMKWHRFEDDPIRYPWQPFDHCDLSIWHAMNRVDFVWFWIFPLYLFVASSPSTGRASILRNFVLIHMLWHDLHLGQQFFCMPLTSPIRPKYSTHCHESTKESNAIFYFTNFYSILEWGENSNFK